MINTMAMFFYWLFVESTMRILHTWRFFFMFGSNFFSVPLLVRTFFSPWHRYWYGYPKNFDPVAMLETIFGNLMSRIIGVFLRTVFIALGIIFDAFVFVIGFAALVFWVTLPFVTIYLFYLGIRLAS